MKRKLRRLWLRIVWVLAGISMAGCMSPPIEDSDLDDSECIVDPSPVEPRPDPLSDLQSGSSVSFSMDTEQFANLAKWLGDGNTLSIEKPVHVQQGGATLDAKAGTRFSYAMADDSGKFTFEKPYPTVKAGIAKMIGGVSLHEVTINADGSGLAATGLGKYRFRWMGEEDAGASVASELPEMVAYSSAGCPPCAVAKRELTAAKDLPFRVTWKESAPAWVAAYPTFHWQVSGDDWRQRDKWDGVEKLVEMWRKSREPKKVSAAASRPFAQPDPHATRAVARGRYHAGHDCPRCGRMQFEIENNTGPDHTHRCGACGNSWWHWDK